MSAATLAELQQHRYEISSNDFLRFREDPLDDTIARIVASVAEGDEDERASVRNELTSDDVDTLLTFAQRRVVRAHRSGDGAAARAALDALAVIPPRATTFMNPGARPPTSWPRAKATSTTSERDSANSLILGSLIEPQSLWTR